MAHIDFQALPDFSSFMGKMIGFEKDWRAGTLTSKQWDEQSRKEIEQFHGIHPEVSRYDLALTVIEAVQQL